MSHQHGCEGRGRPTKFGTPFEDSGRGTRGTQTITAIRLMHYLNLTLSEPAANLALDEALLLDAEEGHGGEVLRLWELPAHTVVLGSAGKLAEDVNEAACRRDGVPILRRCSGGGTVLIGPGCLCYSLVLALDRPRMKDITHSYAVIMDRLVAALAPLAPGIARAGCSDLAVEDWKVSGNSQRRMRSFLLHHGTMLYNFELEAMSRYLHLPQRQPAYRRGRAHTGFVTTIGTDLERLRMSLRQGWEATQERTGWPAEVVRQLVAEKYDRAEWIRRR